MTLIGQTFSRGLLSQINLNFFATDSSELPTAAEVAHDVVEEGVWASMPFYHLGEMSAATYLQDNANDVTAFRFVAQAPSTITNAVWYSMNNLRPYDHPVAQAITLVALMLMPIFSFIMTMTNNAVREVIAPFLTTRAYIIYRLVSPSTLGRILFMQVISFFGGSLFSWYGHYGLATESPITVLGSKFMVFFLLPIIIVNVAVVSLPHELQPWIHRYGVALPFYNSDRIVRTASLAFPLLYCFL
ncbi:hypothetical protein AYX13_01788 [Cryptococcus neoformans]|nr:hypothetical protein AYX13_01788 [Cryptococcus neoformans var. grubii]